MFLSHSSFVLYACGHCLAGTQIRFSSRIHCILLHSFTLYPNKPPRPCCKKASTSMIHCVDVVFLMMWGVWHLFRWPQSSILVSSGFRRIFLQLVSHIPSVDEMSSDIVFTVDSHKAVAGEELRQQRYMCSFSSRSHLRF